VTTNGSRPPADPISALNRAADKLVEGVKATVIKQRDDTETPIMAERRSGPEQHQWREDFYANPIRIASMQDMNAQRFSLTPERPVSRRMVEDAKKDRRQMDAWRKRNGGKG
jgi:hypothetical protein